MVTTPQKLKKILLMRTTTMSGESKVKTFRKTTAMSSQQEAEKVNKESKDKKKQVKEIVKSNIDAAEIVAKANNQAATRMEDHIAKWSENLMNSNKEIQESLKMMTSMMSRMTNGKNTEQLATGQDHADKPPKEKNTMINTRNKEDMETNRSDKN